MRGWQQGRNGVTMVYESFFLIAMVFESLTLYYTGVWTLSSHHLIAGYTYPLISFQPDNSQVLVAETSNIMMHAHM
jgi:hypothetical protein